MEANNSSIASKKKDFNISLEKDKANLSICCSKDSIIFTLNNKNENNECVEFEKSFTFEEPIKFQNGSKFLIL